MPGSSMLEWISFRVCNRKLIVSKTEVRLQGHRRSQVLRSLIHLLNRKIISLGGSMKDQTWRYTKRIVRKCRRRLRKTKWSASKRLQTKAPARRWTSWACFLPLWKKASMCKASTFHPNPKRKKKRRKNKDRPRASMKLNSKPFWTIWNNKGTRWAPLMKMTRMPTCKGSRWHNWIKR